MLILLPPSEGKTIPLSGGPLDIDSLSYPSLRSTRRKVLAALTKLCRTDPKAAVSALGLGPLQAEDVKRNARLRRQPCAPAIEVYSGVLFEALDYASLATRARDRADESVVVASGLWGLVRPRDLIPAYRLSGSVTLPDVGSLRAAWRRPVSRLLAGVDDLIVDMRSGMYQQLAPTPRDAVNWQTIRVLEERNGRRMTVSHSNKATKGRIARSLLEADNAPASADSLLSALADGGFHAEVSSAQPATIDVIVDCL